jgi:hypothetical protein
MAISRLTSLTYDQYRALTITPFQITPGRTQTGSPDPNAQINLAGWVGTDTIAFTVGDNEGTQAALTIDPVNPDTIDLNVTPNINPAAIVTYWTINMGNNAINSQWQISFDVASSGRGTGIWVFTKGKITGDDTDK